MVASRQPTRYLCGSKKNAQNTTIILILDTTTKERTAPSVGSNSARKYPFEGVGEKDMTEIEPQQPTAEGLNKKKLPLEVYHRFEWFWYEPEVTEILEDLFSGESEEVSKLTDRILALNGEGWRVAIITKPNPEPQQPVEGELVSTTELITKYTVENYATIKCSSGLNHLAKYLVKAQLVHCKKTMVRLPSEERASEIAIALFVLPVGMPMGKELLRLLKG